jgi:hypothetical protein
MGTRPFVGSSAGYVTRSIEQFPRQGAEGPWQVSNDHHTNVKTLRLGPVADKSLRFGSTPGSSPAGQTTGPQVLMAEQRRVSNAS